MARRHYRAAKKKIEKEAENTAIFKKKDTNKVLALAAGILVLVFLKGLLLGFLAGRQN